MSFSITSHRINRRLIAEHWDDLLRLAGSLKLGVVQATSIMRTLQISDRPTKLAQAVAELGRIDKTIHALTYIDDETKRRRTLYQLNKGEDRHKLARTIFHGKQGELRQRYWEGQEDQLGALGLVVNIIVLWNTIYIDAALLPIRACFDYGVCNPRGKLFGTRIVHDHPSTLVPGLTVEINHPFLPEPFERRIVSTAIPIFQESRIVSQRLPTGWKRHRWTVRKAVFLPLLHVATSAHYLLTFLVKLTI
jgi:Tn3 transposase DDE domain